MNVTITAKSIVNPTEDEAKVQRALRNLFPSASLVRTSSPEDHVTLRFRGEGIDSLSTIRNLIRQGRIRSAARSILLSRARSGRIQFWLNKQVAFVGRISFCESEGESPHGPVTVEIEAPDVQMVIDYLASEHRQTPGGRFTASGRR